MTLRVYEEMEQGSDAWHQARCGIITASVIGQLITTKTVKPASNETARSLIRELTAQRITGHVEETYQSRDMERGVYDEPYARDIYAEHYAPVTEVGFMVREEADHIIGYSPDGLVGDDGLIEIKSRRQKVHLAHILDGEVPDANYAQLQCALFVSGREWVDYCSFSAGMRLWVKRVYPEPRWFEAIEAVALGFEAVAAELTEKYEAATKGAPETEYVDQLLGEGIVI